MMKLKFLLIVFCGFILASNGAFAQPCTCAFLLGHPSGYDAAGDPIYPPGAPTWKVARGKAWTWSWTATNDMKIIPHLNTWRKIGMPERYKDKVKSWGSTTPVCTFTFGFSEATAKALYRSGCVFKYRISVKNSSGV